MTDEPEIPSAGGPAADQFADEARERWGDTEAYRDAARRTAGYADQDWQRLRDESREIEGALVALMIQGAPSDGPAALELAERHRAHISKWFYECTPEIHAGLGRMYMTDPRFTERIDEAGPGLAAYLSAAIAANHRAQTS